MNRTNALTLVEVLVVIGVLVLLLAIVMPVLERPRGELSHGYLCLCNLRDLTIAWTIYADDNDGRIVNGAAGNERLNEPAWTGKDWADDYREGGALDPNEQEEAIKSGALWSHVKSVGAYRCPTTMPENIRTYSIVDSLNGVPQPGNPMGRGPTEVMDKLIEKSRRQIRRPHERIVFIDEGWAAPGSYGVYYDKEKWWDPPPVRHRKGTTVSFADAHAGHWKWKGEETVTLGKSAGPTQLRQHIEPKTVEGKEDLQKMQEAVWGKLGYEPEP